MTEEHKGLPVAGYRPQSNDNVARVNVNKQLEERVLRQLDELKNDPTVDQRWLAIGRTAIENGFMAVNRSIFKPERVALVHSVDIYASVASTVFADAKKD
jgi:hypothetical protein